VIPEKKVETVHLLTFPRILGAVFNPLSVYVAGDASGRDILYIYEVRNTFGDMHAYIGAPTPLMQRLRPKRSCMCHHFSR
jgi:DUF1365 family protein